MGVWKVLSLRREEERRLAGTNGHEAAVSTLAGLLLRGSGERRAARVVRDAIIYADNKATLLIFEGHANTTFKQSDLFSQHVVIASCRASTNAPSREIGALLKSKIADREVEDGKEQQQKYTIS